MSAFEEILQAIIDGEDPSTVLPPGSRGEVLLEALLQKIKTESDIVDGHTTQLEQIATEVSSGGSPLALIETITVGAGGATSIVKTAEPDETPYAFTGIMLDVHLVGVLESGGDITIAPSGSSVALTPYSTDYYMSEGTDAYFRCSWCQERGIWRPTFADFFFVTPGFSEVYEYIGDPIFVADCAAIDTISITSTLGLPENCVIKIYGIRESS